MNITNATILETPKNRDGSFYTIKDIENMSEETAFAYAIEKIDVKGHSVYIIDFCGYFGYSAIVFFNGHEIKYANEYQLHHKSKEKDELHDLYIELLNSKLFTDDELSNVESYIDYSAKSRYLRDYYPLREDGISIWFCGSEKERAARLSRTKSMFYSNVCFAFFEKRDFVEKIDRLFNALERAKDALSEDFEYQKNAFLHEMYEHEYGINWQADYDTISAFANVNAVKDYTDLNELFGIAKFTETQKRAYFAARKEYYDRERDNL